jgi:hypothetical protein
MKFKVQLVLCAHDGRGEKVQEVAKLEQTHQQIEPLGLTLAEAKQILLVLAPRAQVEMTFEPYEEEDAHIDIRLPHDMIAEDANRLEPTVGERCNALLLDTGLFILSTVAG